MQKMVNSLAFQAHRLAFDGNYMSPFSKRARENGINALGKVFYIDFLKQTKILYLSSSCYLVCAYKNFKLGNTVLH